MLTKEDLIAFKLNQSIARRNPKEIVTFIVALLSNPTFTFQSILDDMKAEASRRVTNLQDAQAKTTQAVTDLNAVDVTKL